MLVRGHSQGCQVKRMGLGTSRYYMNRDMRYASADERFIDMVELRFPTLPYATYYQKSGICRSSRALLWKLGSLVTTWARAQLSTPISGTRLA